MQDIAAKGQMDKLVVLFHAGSGLFDNLLLVHNYDSKFRNFLTEFSKEWEKNRRGDFFKLLQAQGAEVGYKIEFPDYDSHTC